MKILVFGSINIDMVFSVNHMVLPGETIKSSSMTKNAGGKGANQSVALAKSGSEVYFAGRIGSDGLWLKDLLSDNGVDITYLKEVEGPTGQAIIQLDKNKQNSIIILSGANGKIAENEIDEVLSNFDSDDYLVLQNEIPKVNYLINMAKAKGMKICLNPSPFEKEILDWNLEKVDLMIVNEIEASQLLQTEESDCLKLLDLLTEKYINCDFVLTAGSEGAYYKGKEGVSFASSIDVKVVDTTAAGDTFLGYFVTLISEGNACDEALSDACFAAGLAVSKFGAIQSIPTRKEVRG